MECDVMWMRRVMFYCCHFLGFFCVFFCINWKGTSANAGPHYQKLYARVTHIWGNRRSQPSRSAMRGPHPERTSYMIKVPLASGKFILKTGLLGYKYPCANRTRNFFFIKIIKILIKTIYNIWHIRAINPRQWHKAYIQIFMQIHANNLHWLLKGNPLN